MWLNEGFATYGEWMWLDEAGCSRWRRRRRSALRRTAGRGDRRRRPDRHRAVRARGVRGRGDGAPRAAPRGRRRRLLRDPAPVGRAATAAARRRAPTSDRSPPRSPDAISASSSMPGSARPILPTATPAESAERVNDADSVSSTVPQTRLGRSVRASARSARAAARRPRLTPAHRSGSGSHRGERWPTHGSATSVGARCR